MMPQCFSLTGTVFIYQYETLPFVVQANGLFLYQICGFLIKFVPFILSVKR